MTDHTTMLILLATVATNGLLAGASLDQSIKQLPARKRMGTLAFARYSQAADLTNGVPWYATLGIGTAVLSLAAAVITLAQHPNPAATTALIALIVATLAHSTATARAAPTNFAQRRAGNDETALTVIFDRFTRWQTVRVTLQVTALVAAMVAVATRTP